MGVFVFVTSLHIKYYIFTFRVKINIYHFFKKWGEYLLEHPQALSLCNSYGAQAAAG
jgi:hypothetical protein